MSFTYLEEDCVGEESLIPCVVPVSTIHSPSSEGRGLSWFIVPRL